MDFDFLDDSALPEYLEIKESYAKMQQLYGNVLKLASPNGDNDN